jgi:hypothetical protein
MLSAFWSATGGSGTSVITAACAVALARRAVETDHGPGARVADLAGDLPAVFGLGADPDVGLVDWLAAGPEAPTDALDRLLVDVGSGLALLPRGGRAVHAASAHPAPEAGAALAVALGHGSSPVLVDCGTAREPAVRALVEVADVSFVVLRSCYLSLRRAVQAPGLSRSAGIVLLDEPGRSLSTQQMSDVLELPVLVRVPVKAPIARAVDAGVLTTRMPDALARAANELVRCIGAATGRRGEAA